MEAEDFLQGKVLLIDKPLEWTSFQAVNKVRWLIRKRFNLKKIKVGHAGTLDPLASGLLIICVGKFTKRIAEFQGQEKEYTGIIRLGSTTPSYDLETEFNATFPIDGISEKSIYEATAQFIGKIAQKAPVFSALKKDGKRLYDMARSGKDVEAPTREIEITEFEITGIEMPDVHFRVVCSKGTYIRSLAHDFGKALNNGAHLAKLTRTRIGTFSLKDAVSIEEFEAVMKS